MLQHAFSQVDPRSGCHGNLFCAGGHNMSLWKTAHQAVHFNR